MPAVTVGRENSGDIEIYHEDHGTGRQVMQDYLDTLVKGGDYPAYFSEDVAVTIEGAGQRADGREPADFVGTHTGEFAGISATAKAVHVPYSVLYDLSGDQISALRIYFPVTLLMEQLTS